MNKYDALAEFLDVTTLGEPLEVSKHDENTFKYEHQEYLVLTDEEAGRLAKEWILDSVWAFNPSFLASHCEIDEDDIEMIQDNGRCEDNNKIFLRLLNDPNAFVEDAIKCDGRGHFMSSYDGEEYEFFYKDSTGTSQYYYIYRTN